MQNGHPERLALRMRGGRAIRFAGGFGAFNPIHAKIPAFPMRRFSAISLLVLMMLPVLMPLTTLGQDDEDANLPLCCRRHGGMRHHCAMMTAYLESRLPGTKLMATPVPCPDCPSTAPVSRHFQLGLNSAHAHFAEIGAHPAIHTQTEARARVALDRAWRKRGPPASPLS
ncbi:MAG TPA: hypothetical protein VL967_00570 [Terracidiphilus sp.]|nr:hypothetical protein [Terracidiphilus sp.]